MHHLFPLTESVVTDITAVPEGVYDKLMYGLNIAVIGLGTVFAVLIILMCVLYLFRLFFYTIPKRKKAEAEPVKTVKTVPVPAAPAVLKTASADDELIPVVIAAAVAAYMENTAPHSKYRIRSFKRI